MIILRSVPVWISLPFTIVNRIGGLTSVRISVMWLPLLLMALKWKWLHKIFWMSLPESLGSLLIESSNEKLVGKFPFASKGELR